MVFLTKWQRCSLWFVAGRPWQESGRHRYWIKKHYFVPNGGLQKGAGCYGGIIELLKAKAAYCGGQALPCGLHNSGTLVLQPCSGLHHTFIPLVGLFRDVDWKALQEREALWGALVLISTSFIAPWGNIHLHTEDEVFYDWICSKFHTRTWWSCIFHTRSLRFSSHSIIVSNFVLVAPSLCTSVPVLAELHGISGYQQPFGNISAAQGRIFSPQNWVI